MPGHRPHARSDRQAARQHQRLARAASWLALVVAAAASAAGLAFAIVRLVTRSLGIVPVGTWPRTAQLPAPFSVVTPSQTPAAKPPLRVSGGMGVLLGSMVGVAALLLLAAGAEALRLDQRPDDFQQPLPERRLVGADLLDGYQWADQEAGTLRIPIDRAMDLLAERGLPARRLDDGHPYLDSGRGGPSDSSGGRWPGD